jgi:multidrug efflux system outer membrane protein
MDNNLFAQIGFVVLIGLACKNAVLIVQFARLLQEAGKNRVDAAIEASRLRLRPILMTSLAFAFGVLPLMLSRGAGAEMRRAIGTAVFWGMLGVTFFGIFLTPVFYVVIRRIVERRQTAATGAASGVAVSGVTASLLVLGLASAFLLIGCAAGPNYHPPQTKTAAAFANGGQTNLSAAAAETNWWRGFNDATLDGLVERTVAANHDLRIATARVREARALRAIVALDALPTVHAGASYTKAVGSKDSTHGLPREQREVELYNSGLDAAWELDLFGRVRRSLQAGTAEVAAAEALRRDLVVTLISEVARNYFELRGAQNELNVARQNAQNQRETLDITLAKLQAGRATELDTARARAQLDATLALLPLLETSAKRAVHRLGVLSGQEPTALEPGLAQPQALPALPPLVAIGAPAELLRRRPDIRAAERALAAATARIGVATADLFPRVAFNGRLALEAGEFSALGKAGSDTYSFGPGITWAALDLGRVRARIKAAHARADAELAFYEKTVLTALEETENALVEFGRAQARRDYLEASARAAQEAVTLANDRYRSGIADFLPVLDAQRTQLSIQQQLAQSQTLTATALVAVYKALGGGWESEARPPSAATPAAAPKPGGS